MSRTAKADLGHFALVGVAGLLAWLGDKFPDLLHQTLGLMFLVLGWLLFRVFREVW